MRTKELVKFIRERDLIREKRANGDAQPWTKDPVLRKYRFCNVRREDDAVTKWLRVNWYSRFAEDPDVWFTAIVARLFNQPDALEAIRDYVLPYKPETIRKILHARKAKGLKNFNAAYIVSTNGVAMDKVDYIMFNVLALLWAERTRMRPKSTDTLEVYHNMLMSFDGLGSFIAAQVVADLKYLPPLKFAEDWGSFAASGPGSRRGLNRVMGRPVAPTYNERKWREDLRVLRFAVNAMLEGYGVKPLHAQDLQNCLCEFDKYERARLGEGTPKQIFKERK